MILNSVQSSVRGTCQTCHIRPCRAGAVSQRGASRSNQPLKTAATSSTAYPDLVHVQVGIDIFFREAQTVWPELVPFVDGRSGT